jgi:rubrerythrin
VRTSDPAGRSIFKALQEDEQNHLNYLKNRLEKWQREGSLSIEMIESAVPSSEVITKELGKLKPGMERDDRKDEKQMLSKALQVEVETSDFYRRLAAEMDGEARQMFVRFLEIEAEHIAIVQAQLDYIGRTGYWFDIKEFDME